MRAILAFLGIVLFSGCATIFKGYESRVVLYYASDSLKVFTPYGEELPIENETFKIRRGTVTEKAIYLRSNRPHALILKSNGKEKVVSLNPKLSVGWLILDIIFGGIPLFVDLYTDNLNHFDDINAYLH